MLRVSRLAWAAAKHAEDSFLVAAAEDGADPALTLDEEDDDRHRVSWMEAKLRAGRLVVDRSQATQSLAKKSFGCRPLAEGLIRHYFN
jgi:hypothetical protein